MSLSLFRIDPLRRLLGAALLCCAALAGAASAAPAAPAPLPLPRGLSLGAAVEGITEYRLANGLQVLLVPDASKPTTTVNLTYRVGSRHENYGETGMAHLLEHLIFKGTPKNPNVWAEFSQRGLRANGTTWFDRTNYFASFAANEANLQWFLSWHADAMVNSFIAKKDLDTEMTVVRNEMESGENSPGRILYQKTLSAMYDWHAYGKDTIGARADVENVDIGRLQAFYRRYYQPDNATLIVSGQFDPAKVLAVVAREFGRIPKPQRALPRLYTLDAAQDGERSVTLRRVGGTPLLYAAYHLPPAAHPDFAAAELLSLVLGDGSSGRLQKQLVEAGLAAAIGADTLALHDPGVAIFVAQPGPQHELARAREALIATVEGFAAEPVREEELNRARAQWLKAWDQTFSNPEKVGIALSDSVAQGDWRLFFLLRDRVEQASAADLQRVATERLLPANRTLATYLPTEAPKRAPAPAAVDVAAQFQGFKPRAAEATAAAFDTRPEALDRATTRGRLPGGLRYALLPKPTRGAAVQARLTLRYGTLDSLKGQGEVPGFVAALLDKGTPTLSRAQIQDRLLALKTELAISGQDGAVTLALQSKRDTLPEALALVGQLLREASFPPAVLEELRAQALAQIESQRQDPEARVEQALARHGNPYPRDDPRHAASFDESVADLQALKVEDLRAFHRRFYGASHGEFSAVGDFDPEAVRSALARALDGWASAEPQARIPLPAVPVAPARLIERTPDKQNATLSVRLSGLALTDLHADYPALLVGNQILGLGGSARLWKRIREKEGLSYSVVSFFQWNPVDANASWKAEAIFAPQNLAKVEAGFREEVARLLKDGITPAELEETRKGLLAARALRRAQDAQLAASLSSQLLLERSFATEAAVDAAIAGLTVEQVNAALRRWLQPERFVVAVGGDFKD